MDVKIELNESKILQKVTGDKFGLLVSNEWKRLINPYTPRNMGLLEGNCQLSPFEIWYKENYAHYMYEGIVYVDPVTKAAGFLDKDGNWKSRYGVKKIPSERSFNYQKKNPYSTDHWDIKAAQAGQLDKLYRILNAQLKSNKI